MRRLFVALVAFALLCELASAQNRVRTQTILPQSPPPGDPKAAPSPAPAPAAPQAPAQTQATPPPRPARTHQARAGPTLGADARAGRAARNRHRSDAPAGPGRAHARAHP